MNPLNKAYGLQYTVNDPVLCDVVCKENWYETTAERLSAASEIRNRDDFRSFLGWPERGAIDVDWYLNISSVKTGREINVLFNENAGGECFISDSLNVWMNGAFMLQGRIDEICNVIDCVLAA